MPKGSRARRVPRRNQNGRATRAKVLAAAERLFAERGIDAVSTRDITAAAGVNTAAIHYHFGSRRDLLAALIERRAADLGERRDRYLAALDANPRPDLRAVVDALVRPTAELASRERDGRHHGAFIVAVTSHPELMPLVRGAFDAYTDRYLRKLARVTPHLDAATRRVRYGVARDLVNRVVGQPGGPLQSWLAKPGERVRATPDAAIVAAVTEMVVAIFAAGRG